MTTTTDPICLAALRARAAALKLHGLLAHRDELTGQDAACSNIMQVNQHIDQFQITYKPWISRGHSLPGSPGQSRWIAQYW